MTTQAPMTDKKSAAAQIRQKADAALLAVDQAEQDAQQRLQTSQAELNQLQASALERSTRLAGLRDHLALLTQQIAEATTYAGLAQDTADGPESLRKLKELQKQQKQINNQWQREEEAATHQATQESERLAVLRGDIADAQEFLASVDQRRSTTTTARQRAHNKLVDEVVQSTLMRHQEQQAKIDEARRHLVEEQAAMELLFDDMRALQAEWPELVPYVKSLLPANENANTKALVALISYIDILLKDGRWIDSRLLPYLIVPSDEIFVYENIGGHPERLTNRRARIAALLESFRTGRA